MAGRDWVIIAIITVGAMSFALIMALAIEAGTACLPA